MALVAVLDLDAPNNVLSLIFLLVLEDCSWCCCCCFFEVVKFWKKQNITLRVIAHQSTVCAKILKQKILRTIRKITTIYLYIITVKYYRIVEFLYITYSQYYLKQHILSPVFHDKCYILGVERRFSEIYFNWLIHKHWVLSL